MKKVVYIHQYFKTPEEGGAIRSYHIAKEMVNRAIKVDMITSHNKPVYHFQHVAGINVHYLPVSYSNDLSFLKRYIAFIKFAIAAIRYFKKLKKPDLVYATSTPLTVGIVALCMKWTKGIPYLFEVRDLWPEAPIQLGILKNQLLKLISKRLEKIIYKHAIKIIALSPGIERGILHRYGNAKINLIPNMADVDFFNHDRSRIHKKKQLIIGYFGAFGLVNNLEFILNLANECQKVKLPIIFKLVGEGAKKKEIEQMIQEMKLKNVHIFPHKNHSEIKELMDEVDACVTSFLKVPILETSSPNKFFDGLAAGKLSIVNTKGWLKTLVEENRCGIYIDPDEVYRFPKLIQPFIEDKALLKSYQKNALLLANQKFSKDKLVGEICDLILSI